MPDAPSLNPTSLPDVKRHLRDAWNVAFPDTEMPSSLQASERPIVAVTLAEGGYSGLLVALWLEPEQAAQLAVAGGEPADSLHLTLAYCPDMADVDDVTLARVVAALADVAALHTEITGTIGGAGRFYGSDSSDGQDVFYAVPDVPGLDYFRESVLRALGQAGVYAVSTEHSYTPHITLQYLPRKAKTPASPAAIDLTFSNITVTAGVRRYDIPFWRPSEGTDYVGIYEPAYAYYAERTVAKPSTGRADKLWRFTAPVALAEPAEWIQYLPAPGTYHHALWGQLRFTPDKLERLVSNFNSGIYQQELPVDIDHDYKLSGAVGYITDMRLAQTGGIEVKVDWTERGETLLDEDRFKYVSAEFFDEWQNPVTGEWIKDVPIGMAITTHPHFKTDVLRPLAASEIEPDRDTGETRKESIGMSEAEKKTPPAAEAVQLSEADIAEFRAFKEQGGLAKFTQLSEQNERLATDVTSLQAEARQKRFTDIVRGRAEGSDGVAWQGEVQKHVSFLTKLAEAFGDDSDEVREYIDTQTKQASAFAEAVKPLTKPTGTGQGGDEAGSALAKLEQAATALREADPSLTHAQAMTKAYEQADADLRRAYRSERPTYSVADE